MVKTEINPIDKLLKVYVEKFIIQGVNNYGNNLNVYV